MKSVSGRHGMADEMLYTIRVLRSKLARMKKEQRDGGGVLFRSPKENQKGRHNGGGHRIASGLAAESGQPGCKASGESRGIIHREKLAFPWDFPGFLWARSSQAFRNPSVTRDNSLGLSIKQLREEWVQGDHPLARGSGAAKAPASSSSSYLSLCELCFRRRTVLLAAFAFSMPEPRVRLFQARIPDAFCLNSKSKTTCV